MTEEQNKLADEIDVLIGRLRMHAGASDTHIPRPLLATAADALTALREREPATEAVLDETEKMLLTRQSWLDEGKREGLEEAANKCKEAAAQLRAFADGQREVGQAPIAAANESKADTAEVLERAIRALKGKGASQGAVPDIDKVADACENLGRHQTDPADVLDRIFTGAGVCPRCGFNLPELSAPEPSGEFVRVLGECRERLADVIQAGNESKLMRQTLAKVDALLAACPDEKG